jgi:hypothetical protein
VNKKVPGFMKNECGGNQVTEFCGLHSKMYGLKVEDGTKSAKGYVVEDKLIFDDYNNCKNLGKDHIVSMNGFKSYRQTITTVTTTKIGLSAGDDKRVICENKFNTIAHRHYSLKKVT